MELNWSTFVLEIVNFLVLMWLLKRFFYRPLLEVIDQRQSHIKQQLTTAEQHEQDAKALQARYQQRLDDWEKEKQQAHQALLEALKQEREQRLQIMADEIEQLRQKAEAVNARQQQDLITQAEQRAYDQASAFATQILSRLASPELEAQIIALVLEDLDHLPQEQAQALQTACSDCPHAIEITTAYPLLADQKERLAARLRPWLGAQLNSERLTREHGFHFKQSPELLAGLRICIGAWRLEASLADELRYFSQHSQFVQDNHLDADLVETDEPDELL